MNRHHVVAALLALGSLAALPACSAMNDGHANSPAPMARQELSPGMVKQVQTTLQQQGTYTGNIDGLWGPATQAAVRSYQQSHSLAATGELNSATLASLNIPSDGSAPAMQPTASATTTSSTPPAPTMPAPQAVTTTSTTVTTPAAPATQ